MNKRIELERHSLEKVRGEKKKIKKDQQIIKKFHYTCKYERKGSLK